MLSQEQDTFSVHAFLDKSKIHMEWGEISIGNRIRYGIGLELFKFSFIFFLLSSLKQHSTSPLHEIFLCGVDIISNLDIELIRFHFSTSKDISQKNTK